MKLLQDLDNVYQAFSPYVLCYYLGFGIAVILSGLFLIAFFIFPIDKIIDGTYGQPPKKISNPYNPPDGSVIQHP